MIMMVIPFMKSITIASQQHSRAANKLFAVEEQEHSRIYKALNPDKLWYESRREREMAKEDDEDDDIDYKVGFGINL